MAAVAADTSGKPVQARLRMQAPPADAPGGARDTRRGVAFDGFGLLEDGTSFRLSLVDLSYDGCRIATDIALFPGVEFQLALHGFSGRANARVVWHKDGKAGVKFDASDPRKRSKRPRAHKRLALDTHVTLRRIGRKAYQGRLFDLTPGGCKVECIERPRPGELLWAKFGKMDAVEAQVRWVDGFNAGLQFVRPFHPAMFDFLVAKLDS